MNLNIEKLFTGVIDFFAILLPGALLTFFVQGRLEDVVAEQELFPEIPTGYGVVAFLLIAYIVGHLVNSIGAWFLDKYYNSGGWKKFDKNYNLTYLTALDIRKRYLPDEDLKKKYYDTDKFLLDKYAKEEAKKARKPSKDNFVNDKSIEVINTFQWAKRILSLHKEDALAEVTRLEADQKFFRSLVVASLMPGLWLLGEGKIWTAVLFIFISIFSFRQYCVYRYKTNDLAFNFLIAIETASKVPKGEN